MALEIWTCPNLTQHFPRFRVLLWFPLEMVKPMQELDKQVIISELQVKSITEQTLGADNLKAGAGFR